MSLLLGLLEDEGETITPFRPLVRLNAFAVFYRYETLEADAPLGDRAALAAEVSVLVEHVRRRVGR